MFGECEESYSKSELPPPPQKKTLVPDVGSLSIILTKIGLILSFL